MLFFLIKKIEFQSIELSTCLDTVVSVFFFEKSVSLDFFFAESSVSLDYALFSGSCE